jgi:hypothetical protein
VMKKCNKCDKEKSSAQFHIKRAAKDGRASLCKECVSQQKKDHYINNKKHISEKKKRYYQENNMLLKQRQKENYRKNKEHILERNRGYYFLNKDKIISQKNFYEQNRKMVDTDYKIRKRVSCAVRQALRSQNTVKGGSTFEHLPYTPQQLKEHIENQFEPWMTWDNWGEWHIDHIIPQSALLYDSLEHPNFQKCWALDNLRPLKAEDNLKKSNKII